MEGPKKPLTKRRKQYQKNKCFSCRKLKIKCDEGVPACEYCAHTGRKCIYPPLDQVAGNGPNESLQPNVPSEVKEFTKEYLHKATQLMTATGLVSLNSTTCQMQISKFELRLLTFFHHIYLNEHTNENPSMDRVWRCEVPILWQQSDLVRHSVFSLSAMILWNVCDLPEIYRKDTSESTFGYGRSDFSAMEQSFGIADDDDPHEALSSANSAFSSMDMKEFKDVAAEEFNGVRNLPELKEILYTRSTDYFTKCLRRTYAVMENIQHQNNAVKTQFQAAEIVISGILLFSFLALQPHGLVPLITFDLSVTDLVSMVKGMKISMGKSFPLLYTSSYSGLFHGSEVLHPPTLTEKDVYPLVQNLRYQLEDHLVGSIDEANERKHLTDALNLLEIVFYRTIEEQKPLPFFRYIFLLDTWVYDEAKYSRNIFCLKLLFTYSCLCLMSKLRLYSENNIFTDFLKWYRTYNMEVFGDWRYSDDAAFYDLIINHGLEVSDRNFNVFYTFDPLLHPSGENEIEL